jgi:hypothetical protein
MHPPAIPQSLGGKFLPLSEYDAEATRPTAVALHGSTNLQRITDAIPAVPLDHVADRIGLSPIELKVLADKSFYIARNNPLKSAIRQQRRLPPRLASTLATAHFADQWKVSPRTVERILESGSSLDGSSIMIMAYYAGVPFDSIVRPRQPKQRARPGPKRPDFLSRIRSDGIQILWIDLPPLWDSAGQGIVRRLFETAMLPESIPLKFVPATEHWAFEGLTDGYADALIMSIPDERVPVSLSLAAHLIDVPIHQIESRRNVGGDKGEPYVAAFKNGWCYHDLRCSGYPSRKVKGVPKARRFETLLEAVCDGEAGVSRSYSYAVELSSCGRSSEVSVHDTRDVAQYSVWTRSRDEDFRKWLREVILVGQTRMSEELWSTAQFFNGHFLPRVPGGFLPSHRLSEAVSKSREFWGVNCRRCRNHEAVEPNMTGSATSSPRIA